MTPEAITALAREYAERYKDSGFSVSITEEAMQIIRFLLRRYCLVEKSKVRNRMEAAYEAKKEEKAGHFGVIRWQELNYLFPDIAKEEES